MNTILVAADDSPLSKRVFGQVLAHTDSTVVALHVIGPSGPSYSAPLGADISTESLHGSEEWYERADELAGDIFDELAALVNGSGIELRTETLRGNPARTIVDFVCREGIDAAYLGGRGRADGTDLLFGNVAELITLRAPTSAPIVRWARSDPLADRSSLVSIARRCQPMARIAPERRRA